jgi:hypothetical protein
VGKGRLGEREGTRRHVNVDWCCTDDLVGEMEECSERDMHVKNCM